MHFSAVPTAPLLRTLLCTTASMLLIAGSPAFAQQPPQNDNHAPQTDHPAPQHPAPQHAPQAHPQNTPPQMQNRDDHHDDHHEDVRSMNDRNDHRHPTEVFVNGGEPPHDYYHPDYYRPGPRYIPAPIGYRHYRQFYYSTYYPQRPIPVEVSAPYVEVQCSGQQPITGTILGGVAGALVGNQFGHARGNVLATVGGALLGAVIGQSIDQQNESCAYQALEYAEPNTQVGWVDPNSNDAYTVTPGPITQINGLYCREYQAKILVGNTIQNGYGQACRQPDGSWQTAD